MTKVGRLYNLRHSSFVISRSMQPSSFLWATGIEDTFVPQARPGLRALDEYVLTQHDRLWRSDFDLIAETGVQALRWGLPWYRIQPAPDQWDWAWADRALEYLVNVNGITPILDLMHYGTPLWLDNSFINADYPQRVAEYAQAVTARYRSLVRYYTPLNEPMVNAEFSGKRAEWPPYLSGDDGDVKLTMALARGIVLTSQAIRAEQPDAVLVQVEALWRTETDEEALRAQAAASNERQYLSFDLTTGRMTDAHPLAAHLRRHGVEDRDLEWFRDQAVAFDVFGANFYPWSYNRLVGEGQSKTRQVARATSGERIELVLREAHQRSGLPVMITETSAKAPLAGRALWMDETIGTVASLRREGLPIVGYTWFPAFTMIDWAYRRGRRPLRDYLLHLGLYDSAYDDNGVLVRHATELVDRFRRHMAAPMPEVGESG